MTITLGGTTLSDHLVLEGIEDAPAVAFSSRRTLGGRAVMQIGPTLTGGRELSLQSDNHITNAMVAAVKALQLLGQTVTLVHPRLTTTVLITEIQLEQDQPMVNPGASGANVWYSGTINMIEV